MSEMYRVQIQSIHGRCLTCQVTELYQDAGLCPSPTLALNFLWDTVDGRTNVRCPTDEPDIVTQLAPDFAHTSPLGRALANRYYHEDSSWNCENVGRFICCVGNVDLRVANSVDWYERHERGLRRVPHNSEAAQVTFHIGMTDSQWLNHLTPGMEWDNWGFPEDDYIRFHPAWQSPEVLLIAKSIEESQDFSGVPILADALQDAGCDSDDLLNHLRDPNATHVRGCWALDLVLGKE